MWQQRSGNCCSLPQPSVNLQTRSYGNTVTAFAIVQWQVTSCVNLTAYSYKSTLAINDVNGWTVDTRQSWEMLASTWGYRIQALKAWKVVLAQTHLVNSSFIEELLMRLICTMKIPLNKININIIMHIIYMQLNMTINNFFFLCICLSGGKNNCSRCKVKCKII